MSAINDTYTVKFSSTKRKMLTPGAVPSMNLPTDTLVPPDEPTRKYLCPNRQPVPTISVKIEPYCTESFEMEDTKPILGCVGSEMQLNSHIHFSNETILGLEVDYINRDSNNETLSLAHTTNDSDSCTLPPIKEEPKVDYINHDSNNETLTLSLANTTNDSELKASCTLPPIKEESEITIEDTILSQSPRETKSHILNQDKSDCNDEEIHSVAQKHHCIANKFKAEDYLNICMKNDYSIADVSTNYKKKCWMYNCYKEAVKEGYCLKHGGNKSRKWCKMEDCTRCPVKGGYCKPHGGTTIRKLCKKEDCLKWPVKGGYCEAHGGIKSRKPCKKENCTKFPVKGGYCEPHGGTRTRKLCKMKDCSTTAVKGGYCIAHGGIKYDTRCNKEMCFKWPVKGGFCLAHGGTKSGGV